MITKTNPWLLFQADGRKDRKHAFRHDIGMINDVGDLRRSSNSRITHHLHISTQPLFNMHTIERKAPVFFCFLSRFSGRSALFPPLNLLHWHFQYRAFGFTVFSFFSSILGGKVRGGGARAAQIRDFLRKGVVARLGGGGGGLDTGGNREFLYQLYRFSPPGVQGILSCLL